MLPLLLSAFLLPPAAPPLNHLPLGHASSVPFEAVVYARYVMTYRDQIYRSYQTASAGQAAQFVKLKAVPDTALGLRPFGSWTTADATYDPFGVYGEDRKVPGAVFIYSVDDPGPPSASSKAAAAALFIERPRLSASEFQHLISKRRGAARDNHDHLYSSQGNTIFSHCFKGANTEYPVMNAAVTQNCVAETYAPALTLRVDTLNVSEQVTVQQLERLLQKVR